MISVIRNAVVATAMALAVALVPSIASAQSSGGTFRNMAATGADQNKNPFVGQVTITQFTTDDTGHLLASGVAWGKVGGQQVRGTFENAPANFVTGAGGDPFGTCPILSLQLGPLNLDVLGLVVTLNQVDLNIVAQSGPGNLLGNLLCAVANLLNGGLNLGVGTVLNNVLQALVAALNSLL